MFVQLCTKVQICHVKDGLGVRIPNVWKSKSESWGPLVFQHILYISRVGKRLNCLFCVSLQLIPVCGCTESWSTRLRHSLFTVLYKAMGWMIQDSIPGRNKRFFLPQIGAHSASYTLGTRVSFLGLISWEVKLTTHVLPGVRPSEWNLASAPPIWFYSMDRDSATFTFCRVFVIVREP
jgi:hypothetical protein